MAHFGSTMLDIQLKRSIEEGNGPLFLELLDKTSYDTNKVPILMEYCAQYGRVELLHALSRISEHNVTSTIASVAARYNQAGILLFMIDEGIKWGPGTFETAAEYGHLDLLKLLVEHKYNTTGYWDAFICLGATLGGHLDVLRWAHKQGYPWNVDVCEAAVYYCNLECLKYLHEHGCPWNKMSEVILGCCNDREILEYLYDHNYGCEYCKLCIEENLRSIWDMEVERYDSYIQWLPLETLDDIIALL